MKKVLIGLAVVVVLIGGGLWYLLSGLDSIVKAAVEDVGSKATKTQVTLKSVKIEIRDGKASLNGFRMTNPAGYKTPDAMRFNLVSVQVAPESVTKDVIVIKEVVIGAPQITYELGGPAGSNIQTIQKNVDAFAKSMGAGGGEAKAESSEGGKKVVIENLYLRDGKIGVSAPFLAGKQMNVPLPAIHLKDIGKKKGGATPAEVADQVLTAISRSATRAVDALGLDKMMGAAKGAAAGAQKMIEGGAGGAQKTLDDVTKGVGDSLKGVFGK